MADETIKIRFGEYDLEEYDFPAIPCASEPPAYMLEAAYLIDMNKQPGFDFDSIPEDDPYIFQEICIGNNDGVYLLERKGVECFVAALAPTSIAGIIDVIVLDRPGPLLVGVTADFIERKQSNLPPQYIHPKLKPILRNSCGVVLYRKQVIEIAGVIAGYTQNEQNELRMLLEECKPGELISHKKRFIDAAVGNWVDVSTAEAIFKQIAYYSKYDYFDEWQASDHALLAYRSAYMKHHYPEEYQTALDNTRFDRCAAKTVVIEEPEHLNPLVSRLLKAKITGQEYQQKASEQISRYW